MLNRKKNSNIEDIDLEIEQWRNQNKKKVEINLFPGENEYLIKKGHTTIPVIFEITDKHFENIEDCPNFMKIKYGKKTKKCVRLKKKEREFLDSLGIEYQALGYIVFL